MAQCKSTDGPQKDVKVRAGEELKTFLAVMLVLNVGCVSFGLKRDFCDREEIRSKRLDERHMPKDVEIKVLQSVCGVNRKDRWRSEEGRRRVGITEKLSEIVG